jgi:Leucine-rich repeat (LRR) protein
MAASDLSPLSGMKDLQQLFIYRHHIQNISVLSELTALEILDIHDNDISDLTPLVGLPNLSKLYCDRNPLNDNSCNNVIPQLESNGVYVDSSCGQLSLTITSTAGGHTDPMESEYTYVYGQTVTIRAIADPGYRFNVWTGSYFTSRNPVTIVMDQHHHIQANFISL